MVDFYNQFKDFKSFEVVLPEVNGEHPKLFCNVKSIETNHLVITADNKKNKDVFAKVTDDIKLYIYTDNGIYSASSKVLVVTRGAVSTEYLIAYPTNSKHSQRREYFRADLNIDFKLIITSDGNTKTSTIEGKTKNICGKGMSFESAKPLPAECSVSVELSFEEKKIHTNALPVYSKQASLDSQPIVVNALTFTDISQKNIDFIVKKCFLHQLNLRKLKNQ